MKARLLILLVFCVSIAHAQLAQIDQSILHNNKIPNAPTSASLGVYSDFPVDYFSGKVQTAISLSDLSIDGFKVPLQLSYLPSGVRVMSSAGWVGTNWSLQVGGVVTRTINDQNDDRYANGQSNGYSYSKKPITSFWTQYNTQISKLPIDAINEVTEADDIANSFAFSNFKLGGSRPTYDTEPDNFSYSFLGRSGKFFIDPDKNVLQVPYTDLKFELTFAPEDAPDVNDRKNKLKKVTITDERGVKYIFDKIEMTYNSLYSYRYNLECSMEEMNPGVGGMTSNSAWCLTKIILQNAEEITFTYEPETLKLPYLYRSHSIRNSPDADGDASSVATFHDANRPQMSSSSTTITHYAQRLVGIECRLWKVVFQAVHVREDVEGSNALTAVKIYSKENSVLKLVKNWDFTYRYHQCKTDYQVPDYAESGVPSTIASRYKRLMLTGIKESTSTLINKQYDFNYYEDLPMPGPGSAEQDFWGYYNNNHAKSLLPAISIYPDETLGYKKYSVYHKPSPTASPATLVLPGADRRPSGNNKLGSLKSIMYPTGGMLTFEYEPNTYYFEGTNYQGGGIRIQRTTQYDGIDHARDIVKEYIYNDPADPTKSSGVLFSFPAFAYFENTHTYKAPHMEVFPGSFIESPWLTEIPTSYSATDLRKYTYYLSRLDNPQMINSGINGDACGYRDVTVVVNGKFKTIYHYSSPAGFGETTDPVTNSDYNLGGGGDNLYKAPLNFITRPPGGTGFGENNYGSLNPNTPLWDNPPMIIGMDVQQPFAFPFAPGYNYDWNRGLLLSQREYDQDNKLVKEITRKYTLFSPNGAGPKYLPAIRIGRSENYGLAGMQLPPSNTSQPYQQETWSYMFSKYKVMGDIAKLPAWEETKLYTTTNNGADYIIQRMNFSYKPNTTQLAEVNYTDSKGQLRQVINKYPADFAVNGNVYQEMVNRHMISPVIEQSEFVANEASVYVPLNKQMISYDYFANNQILPATLQSSMATASLETIATNNLYDTKGNLLQYKLKDGINVALLYGYNNSQVVAQVTNRTYLQVAALVIQSVLDNPSSDAALRTELNKIRANIGAGSLVTTMTYSPLLGVTSMTDENNQLRLYEYDAFGRMELVRDKNNNILKRICYNYKGQVEDCNPILTYNTARTASFVRSNCTSPCTGAALVYTVPANTCSAVTVADANILADNDIAKNGQANADKNGQCLCGGIYVKTRRENIVTTIDWTYGYGEITHGDVVARFYADEACTVPVNVTNLTLNMEENYFVEFDYTTTITPFTFICNGSEVKVRQNILLSTYQSDTNTVHLFFAKPGTGYIVKSSANYPWEN